jgi:beta-galactosidase
MAVQKFWVIWYNRYGESANDVTQFDRNTWKIIAYGGNGYNYYMFHGGSNFGFTNNDEDAASYDYGAAIGQGGDLRPFYYRAKRAATFARSFASILEASHNSTSDYASLVDNADLKVTARTATAGTIMFLDNPTHSKVTADLRSADGASTQSVTLEPQQIRPVVMGYSVAPGIDIAESACVSSVYKQTGVTTIVVSGDTEGAAEIDFHVSPSWKVISGNDGFDRQGSSLVLRAKAGDTPRCYRLASGLHQVRVLLVSDAMADRTWFVDAGPRKLIVCGPSYVGDVKMSTGRVLLRDEEPLGRECRKAIAFGDSDTPMTLNRPRSTGSAAPPYVPTLSQWIAVAETAPAAPGFDDSRWLTTGDDPRQMGADGDTSAYAWYRATATVPQTGRYVVSWSRIGDHATLYVDGKPCSPNDLSLPAGPHTIAVFTDHSGRAKAGNIGRLDIVDPKGITGPVGLVQSTQSPSTITSWLVKVLDPQTKPGDAIPPLDDRNWKTVSKDTDVFNGASTYAWFHTDIPPSGSASAELDFQNVDDNADVYVNGIKVGRHEGWGIPFRINAASAWRKGQPNSIDVLVQNASGPGGIYGDTEVNYFDTWVPVKGWRMKGGVPSEDASGNNLPISAGPAHYRSTFTLPSTYRDGDLDGQHPIYRITFAGLSRGSIWLNGHNLGQYPEKIPIDGLYMPECWLQPGINHVTIFDTSGNSPAQVRVEVEQAASRSVFMLSSP